MLDYFFSLELFPQFVLKLDNHFEEDCSWVGVILAFPHLFPLPAVEQAWTVYGRIYANR